MSAIGSVIVIGLPPFLTEVSRSGGLRDGGGDLRRSRYQLLLVTPGSSPRCAISRRHTRQSPNLRYTECGRPSSARAATRGARSAGVRLALTIRPVFATSVLLEREAETTEQRPALVVSGGRGHNGDVHPANPVDLVLVDLVEHRLLGETEGVVPVAVEVLRRQTAEVTDSRQRHRE